MKARLTLALTALTLGAPILVHAVGPEELLGSYRQGSATAFDAEAGRALWNKDFDGRACTSCHGTDLTVSGRHATTGKDIGPMAPSVDQERLTDPRKVEKWLTRNCRWTLGRECSDAEKGNVLSWLLTF